jgi:hypothetical protein
MHKQVLFQALDQWSNFLLFIYFEDKLTHRYNTRANHPRIMEHLEKENKDLKEEISRLTAMMESVLAVQSQASPTPATPPQRTVISEVATSTVPAATAHFAPPMPAGFPLGNAC